VLKTRAVLRVTVTSVGFADDSGFAILCCAIVVPDTITLSIAVEPDVTTVVVVEYDVVVIVVDGGRVVVVSGSVVVGVDVDVSVVTEVDELLLGVAVTTVVKFDVTTEDDELSTVAVDEASDAEAEGDGATTGPVAAQPPAGPPSCDVN